MESNPSRTLFGLTCSAFYIIISAYLASAQSVPEDPLREAYFR